MEKLYRLSEAARLLGVHTKTLQRWDESGLIKVRRTPNGMRRIPQSEIERLAGTGVGSREQSVAVYARVSSHEQKAKGDLERQVELLRTKVKELGLAEPEHIITDVASGLSDKRKGLLRLMKLALEGKITDVLITYKDRLTRFAFGYLEEYFRSHRVRIHVVSGEEDKKSMHEELVDDLLAVVTSFSGRLYGLRGRGKARRLVEAVKEAVSDAGDV